MNHIVFGVCFVLTLLPLMLGDDLVPYLGVVSFSVLGFGFGGVCPSLALCYYCLLWSLLCGLRCFGLLLCGAVSCCSFLILFSEFMDLFAPGVAFGLFCPWGWCRVKAIFPDAGAAALLKYRWTDATFSEAFLVITARNVNSLVFSAFWTSLPLLAEVLPCSAKFLCVLMFCCCCFLFAGALLPLLLASLVFSAFWTILPLLGTNVMS
ncbi:hypothetical protein LXL04_011688 [Taraxacum kok-saghyz]